MDPKHCNQRTYLVMNKLYFLPVAMSSMYYFDYVCYDDTTKVTIIFLYFFPYPSHQFVFYVRIVPLVHRVIVMMNTINIHSTIYIVK